jgi:hypothetical protein
MVGAHGRALSRQAREEKGRRPAGTIDGRVRSQTKRTNQTQIDAKSKRTTRTLSLARAPLTRTRTRPTKKKAFCAARLHSPSPSTATPLGFLFFRPALLIFD